MSFGKPAFLQQTHELLKSLHVSRYDLKADNLDGRNYGSILIHRATGSQAIGSQDVSVHK
jgi:hypothetical protein